MILSGGGSGAARALGGLCVLAALAGAPVVAKGVLEDEDPRSRLVVVSAPASGPGGVTRGTARPRAVSPPVARKPRRARPRRSARRPRTTDRPSRRKRPAARRSPERARPEKRPPRPEPKAPRPTGRRERRPSSPAPRPKAVSEELVGDAVDTQYGTFQFAIVVRDGRIVEVRDVRVPGGKRTEEINASALPQLRAQTIERQSAAVDVISGATTTCEAYRLSLEAAVSQMP